MNRRIAFLAIVIVSLFAGWIGAQFYFHSLADKSHLLCRTPWFSVYSASCKQGIVNISLMSTGFTYSDLWKCSIAEYNGLKARCGNLDIIRHRGSGPFLPSFSKNSLTGGSTIVFTDSGCGEDEICGYLFSEAGAFAWLRVFVSCQKEKG